MTPTVSSQVKHWGGGSLVIMNKDFHRALIFLKLLDPRAYLLYLGQILFTIGLKDDAQTSGITWDLVRNAGSRACLRLPDNLWGQGRAICS